jgi:hypothetical protein
VSGRRGFGDEMWRLALAGDAAALHRAADLLLRDPVDLRYEGHRARAFALAVEGRVDAALAQLNEAWTDDWPFPDAYAADVGRVRFLAGDDALALGALVLAARVAERPDPAAVELAALCVRREPRLLWRALRVATAAGTASQRARAVGAILRARARGREEPQPGIRSTILPS